MNDSANGLLFARAVAAFIEAQGMMAFNLTRERNGYALGYDEQSFLSVLEKYRLNEKELKL